MIIQWHSLCEIKIIEINILKQLIPEEELITLMKAQSKEGFDVLYTNDSNAFYAIILRNIKDPLIAEDLLQEAFIKIWRNIEKYDPAKARLFTWMICIVRNSCIDYLRSPGHRAHQSVKDEPDDTNAVSQTRDREVDYGLLAVVDRMEPKYRDVIHTIFYHSYTHGEAAEALGIPLGTLKSRVKTALVMLKSSLLLSVYE